MKKAWNRVRDFFIKDLWLIDISPFGKIKALSIHVLRLLSILTNDFLNGRLPLWAMSLVYTTLLSLVPLLAVSFSVLKAFGVRNVIEPFLLNILAPLGPHGIELSNRIVAFVDKMNVSVLGFLGLALLLFTVISVIQKIEAAFNAIWRVSNARGFLRRFSDYLSVLVVGPVLVFAALGITASVMSSGLMQRLISIESIGGIISVAGKLVSYLVICAAFIFIYLVVPNTKVKLSSAAVGGIVGGVLWQTVGFVFGSIIASSSQYAAIYSGFAIVILFMIWLYVSWLILLIGAEISYYYQFPESLSIRKDICATDARLLEWTAISIMFLVAENFYRAKAPWTTNALVARLGLTLKPVEDMVTVLERNRLITETAEDPPGYLPARDLETITLNEIVNAVRGRGLDEAEFWSQRIHPLRPVNEIIEKMDQAVVNALGEITLRDIVRLNNNVPALARKG